MVYVFTNVHRFKNDSDFQKELNKLELNPETDILVFMNLCVPFWHAEEYFKKFHLIIINRRKGKTNEWFGYDRVLKLKSDKIIRLRVDDTGLVIDDNYNEVTRLPFGKYTKGKVPTTGYLANIYVVQSFPEEKIVLVNYYGDDDSSTYKTKEHDWKLENDYFHKKRELGNCIFLEPEKRQSDEKSIQEKKDAHVLPKFETKHWDRSRVYYFHGAKI